MIMVNHIDANDMQYTELNRIIRQKPGEYTLSNVNGQRYIGCGLGSEFKINIHGTPGNDLGAFMDGASVNVFGNCQDATGNSMNQGRIIVHGSASDTAGYAMRNGEIFIQGNAGYRVAAQSVSLQNGGLQIQTIATEFGNYGI